MQVLIESGYVSSYALIGQIIGGIEVPEPLDIEHFETHFKSYLIRHGTLEYDEQQNKIIEREALCDDLRKRRETECFSIINRGQLWYDTLSEKQRTELQVWYQGWLHITDTLTVPDRPSWL